MKIIDKFNKIKSKIGIFYHNHRSDILIGVGITSVVGGVIAACAGTRKLDDILDEHEFAVNDLKVDSNNEPMERKEYNKEMAKIYGHTILSLGKAYAPAIGLVGGGIGLIIKAHMVDKEEKQELIAAYNGLWAGFNAYRDRVRDKFGDEEEKKLYFGAREEEKETEVEDKTGKKRKKKEKVDVYPENVGPYAVIFDKFNVNYHREEYDGPYAMRANFMFLNGVQEHLNRRLRIHGQVVLNDMNDAMGLPRSAAGAVVGWRSVDCGGKTPENGIKLGISDQNACIVLSDGLSEAILVNPNVEGLIIDSKFDEISGIGLCRP